MILVILNGLLNRMSWLSILDIREFSLNISPEELLSDLYIQILPEDLIPEVMLPSQVFHLQQIFRDIYQRDITLFSKDAQLGFGLNFSNIGSKMSYSDGQTSDFIPMNMRLGTAGTIELDNFNKLSLAIDFNKLLVPTPPIYNTDMEIIDGKDPNVSVPIGNIPVIL